MPGTAIRWGTVLGAFAALHAMSVAHAQDTPAYRCGSGQHVTYSQVPCGRAKPVGEPAPKPRVNVRYETPSQDRAKIARRAQLTAEARTECSRLDTRLKEQEAELKAMGGSATVHDEMPLVQSKKRFRELKC
jgi:hypothetical protein